MKEYSFFQIDVFTDQPFGGNPLAIFPNAEGLTSHEMGQLAKELNLSETTFVLPPQAPGADFKVRIFTPARELPFAGHPVIGTHWLLAHLGRVKLSEPVTKVNFELGVGVLPAHLHVVNDRVRHVVMTQDRPIFLDIVQDVTELAAGLGLNPSSILNTNLPVQVVSTGIPQLMVPIQSLADVQKLNPTAMNVEALNRVCRMVNTDCAMVFTLETEQPDNAVHTRMFAPALGIPEDPATGSANGALGAYLVHHQVIPVSEPSTEFRSEQGAEMGRPSLLDVLVDVTDDQITSVRIGGKCVPIAEGIIRF